MIEGKGRVSRILLLLNDSNDVPALEAAMENAGVDVVTERVDSTAEGWNVLRRRPGAFDAIVSAYRLRDGDGVEFSRRLREDPELRAIPLILLIDSGFEESVGGGVIEAGVRDYLVKDDAGLYLKIFPYMIRDVVREREVEAERLQTERRLRESEKKYRELVESANSVIMRFDRGGLITFLNEYGEELLGYAKEDVVGARVTDTLWADIVGENMDAEAFLREVMENPSEYTRYEMPTVRGDGGRVRMSWSNRPMYDENGECREILAVGIDVTHRARMEEELQKAKERAEEANRNKSDYLAKMSHEIRTPMNSIIGFANLSLDNAGLDETTRNNLDIIRASGEELLKLIGDVLDLSKIEAGRLTVTREPFDLVDAVQSLVASFTPMVDSNKVTLSCEWGPGAPRRVKTDQTRLTQILRNLVGNAVNHTDSGEIKIAVRVSDHVYRPNADLKDVYILKFEVSDTGAGIPPEERPFVFDPFKRAKNDRSTVGTGLGLAISKHLARLLDGELSLRSDSGKGTTFELTINVPPAEPIRDEDDSAEVAEEEDVVSNRKILSVDDEPNNQTLLRMLMESDGNEMVLADTGRRALELFENDRFDIIFMDLELPDINGREVTREIRQRERRGSGDRHVPIIAVTAYVMKEDRDQCVAAGMDDYVSKPFKLEDIREKIRRYANAAP